MSALSKAWPLLGALVLQAGCINFRQVGREMGEGMLDGISASMQDGGTPVFHDMGREVIEGVNEKIPETSRGVMKGVGEGLRQDVLTDHTTERIVATVDAVGDRATARAAQLVDLILAKMSARSEQLSRGFMRGVGEGLGKDVLVEENERKLGQLLGTLTGSAREQLVGQKAREELVSIVKDVLGQATGAVDAERAKLQQDLTVAEGRFREALVGILVVVLVAGAVGTFLIIQWRRQDRLVQLLTLQIDRIPDEKARDELKHRIQDLASAGGLEPHLRAQLGKQGLLRQQRQAG